MTNSRELLGKAEDLHKALGAFLKGHQPESALQAFEGALQAFRAQTRTPQRLTSYRYRVAVLKQGRGALRHLSRRGHDADGVCARFVEALDKVADACNEYDDASNGSFARRKAAVKAATHAFEAEIRRANIVTDDESDSESDASSCCCDDEPLSAEYRRRCFELRLRLEASVRATAGRPFRTRLAALPLAEQDKAEARDMYSALSAGCHAGSGVALTDAELQAVEALVERLASARG